MAQRKPNQASGVGQSLDLAAAGKSPLSKDDLYWFNEGTHTQLATKLGSHPMTVDGQTGVCFATWAPNAHLVSVCGDFNGWMPGAHPMFARGMSGIWECFIPGLLPGDRYKYHIEGRATGYRADKMDPYGIHHETPPKTASIVWDPAYEWGDADWMAGRGQTAGLDAPISIYEVHLGSWRRDPTDSERYLSYRELAEPLADYVTEMGFTHVEFLPVMEHPFAPSWGYQVTGFFAPSSRWGTPQDFMALIDTLHRRGIGVILDWVPSHFPNDDHGIARFDGTHIYEHADPRQGQHPDWGSAIFNYSRHEVRAFLISSAIHWLEMFHIDGLRVDAVASMLYLDYSRKDGEWIPNEHGGNENLDAISLLRQMNAEIYKRFPDVQTIAEESTSWPQVSRPAYLGGLGFGLKWDMGWMHDTLKYMSLDPIHRKFHHNQLTFRMLYAWHENFVLPLSHDEVVHGKGSLLNKMPGDEWRQHANLRLLYAMMFAQPAKKLLFMGGEFGQRREWSEERALDWELLDYPIHQGLRRWVADLNRAYREHPALHTYDCESRGFEWIDCDDVEHSVISLLRKADAGDGQVVVVANATPVVREGYRVGVPHGGRWRELLNSDASEYGGSGIGNAGRVEAQEYPYHGRSHSVQLTLPPLGAVFLISG